MGPSKESADEADHGPRWAPVPFDRRRHRDDARAGSGRPGLRRLILNTGWAKVHPAHLGIAEGTAIADAMDVARGGRFDAVPDAYPDGAWFTYDDRTCDYLCMVTEYAYWVHTGLLGGQVGRADEIGHEWRLVTPEQVRSGDAAATAVFTDPALGLPTVLPDGDYRG